ncbi:hypothetical protein CF635_003512 [Enterobacter hormaechei]|nr:hypothetical protein [Enterobacter hormaechei]
MNKYSNFTREINKQTREVFKQMKSFEKLKNEIETLQKQANINPEARRKLEAIELLEEDPSFSSNLNKLKLMVKNIEHEFNILKAERMQGGNDEVTIGSDKKRKVTKSTGIKLFLNQSK